MSEPSSEEVHPKSHGSAFIESRTWVSVYWGALHLHYLFNFGGSALRKINFMRLCNLPWSYVYLLNKLCLLLWRPMSHETSFSPFILYTLGRMAGWGLGSHQPAKWLALGPIQCCPGCELPEAASQGQEAEKTRPCYQPPFLFHIPFVPSSHNPRHRDGVCAVHTDMKEGAPPLRMSSLLSI